MIIMMMSISMMIIYNDNSPQYGCNLGASYEGYEDLQACSTLCRTPIAHIHSQPGNDHDDEYDDDYEDDDDQNDEGGHHYIYDDHHDHGKKGNTVPCQRAAQQSLMMTMMMMIITKKLRRTKSFAC